MFRNPYAFRIMTLILLFIDSIRALDNPICIVAIIASLCLRFLTKFYKRCYSTTACLR